MVERVLYETVTALLSTRVTNTEGDLTFERRSAISVRWRRRPRRLLGQRASPTENAGTLTHHSSCSSATASRVRPRLGRLQQQQEEQEEQEQEEQQGQEVAA